MRFFYHQEPWTVRRGMALAGITAVLSGLLALNISPAVSFVLAAGVVLLSLLPPLRRPNIVFCCAVCGVFLSLTAFFIQSKLLPAHAHDGETVTVTARVDDLSVQANRITVAVLHSDRLDQGTQISMYCPDGAIPQKGDIISAEIVLNITEKRYRDNYADGVFLQAVPTGYRESALTRLSHEEPRGFSAVISSVRENLCASLREILPGDTGALLCAVCLGEKQYLTEDLTALFRQTGISHLVAVSGLHLSVLTGALYFFLKLLRLPRRWCALPTALFVLLFVFLTGAPISVWRAAIMCWVLLAGQLFRRPSDGLNSLGFAYCLIALINPLCLYDTSLWLSFGATFGVLLISPRVRRFFRAREERLPVLLRIISCFATDSLALSIGALLPTVPVMAVKFHNVSLLSPLTNLVISLPAAAMLILSNVALLLLPVPVLRIAGKGLLLAGGWMGKAVLTVARAFAPLPGGLWQPSKSWMPVAVVTGCAILIVCLCFGNKKAVLRSAILVSALFLGASLTDRLLTSNTIGMDILPTASPCVILSEGEESVLFLTDAKDGKTVPTLCEDLYHRRITAVYIVNGSPKDAGTVCCLRGAYPTASFTVFGDTEWTDTLPFSVAHPREAYLMKPLPRVTVTHQGDKGFSILLGKTRLLILPEDGDFAQTYSVGGDPDGILFAGVPQNPSLCAPASFGCWVNAPKGKDFPIKTEVEIRLSRKVCRMVTTGEGDWRQLRWQ